MATQDNEGHDTKPATNGFSLANILKGDDDNLEHPTFKDGTEESDEDSSTAPVANGYCIECEGVYLITYVWAGVSQYLAGSSDSNCV